MWRRKELVTGVAALALLGVQLSAPDVYAGELVVHNCGRVTVKSGSILLMNCNNLTVEAGGSFIVDGGEVLRRGRLTVEEGGEYVIESGKVDKCYKSYYVIPGPAGNGAVICL